MTFNDPAWRARPVRTALRVAVSLALRRVAPLTHPVVRVRPDGFRMRVDLRTALGLRLFRYGISDPDLSIVRALLRPGDVFVDGGANVGLFSLTAAARVGSGGRVIAFDTAAVLG